MQAGEGLSLEQIRAFLNASDEVGFKAGDRGDVYAWLSQTLRQQRYRELKRRSRGLVRRYLEKLTGLSRAQITRLITMYWKVSRCSRNSIVGGVFPNGTPRLIRLRTPLSACKQVPYRAAGGHR